MEIFKALLIGLIQGFTEFLPVSSSGHLVLAQDILKIESFSGVVFESVLHLATTFAVIVYFREVILKRGKQYLPVIIIGTFPAAIIGLLFKDYIEAVFDSTLLVAVMLIVTGIINWFTDTLNPTQKNEINFQSAFVTGIAQAVALIPGISRSGFTIFTATAMGVKRSKAAEFSFLLSIPAVLGANLVEFISYKEVLDINWQVLTAGFFTAFLSGFIGIKLVNVLLVSRRFKYFSIYCITVGIVSLLLLLR